MGIGGGECRDVPPGGKCFVISATTLVDVDVELILGDVDVNEYVLSSAGEGVMVDDAAIVADNADGGSVDDGVLIPLLDDDADGATVDGMISVDDTICRISVDDTIGALVDEGSVVEGALINEGISVGGEEHEVLVIVPIGGGVVDATALASTAVPVEAGTS